MPLLSVAPSASSQPHPLLGKIQTTFYCPLTFLAVDEQVPAGCDISSPLIAAREEKGKMLKKCSPISLLITSLLLRSLIEQLGSIEAQTFRLELEARDKVDSPTLFE
jgi:hypothetical protein